MNLLIYKQGVVVLDWMGGLWKKKRSNVLRKGHFFQKTGLKGEKFGQKYLNQLMLYKVFRDLNSIRCSTFSEVIGNHPKV